MNPKKLDNLFQRAAKIAKLSPDSETQVGCIAIRSDGSEIGSSYNGFIPNAPDSKLPKTRATGKLKYITHAEMNLIQQCAKHGNSINGAIAIVTLSPCINCCRALWTCGIKTIYFRDEYRDFKKQLDMLDLKLNLTKVGKYVRIDLEVRE